MNKFKYYILTSSDLMCLKRHFHEDFSNIAYRDAVVVINTQDDEYEAEAAAWCYKHGIEHWVTESNGTPARGKNELIKVFLESDNDYMVQIDSDDFLTPHGVWMYNQVSKMETPPDAICLKHQLSLVLDFEKAEQMFKNGEHVNNYGGKGAPWLESLYFTANWEEIKKYSIYPGLIDLGLDTKTAKKYAGYHQEFYRLQQLYCEDNESHCRVTWLSKKAVQEHRFPENLIVGEDTLFYFLLKNDAINGKLDVQCNDEFPPTYIYDQRTPGTVHKEVGDGTNWSWMGTYNEEVRKMEEKGIVHQKDLPLLQVYYPWDYKPNLLGLKKTSDPTFLFEMETENGTVEGKLHAPANATYESLEERYERVYKYYPTGEYSG